MKIAVIGYGYWGKNLVRNFYQLGVLHTICDTDPEKLQQAKHDYPDVDTTVDYHKVLADERIKGIVIATSSKFHYVMTEQALLANKDVFVEKPFTLASIDAEELVALSSRLCRILLVGHLMLYHPAIQLLKQYIMSGELGEIYYLYSTRVNLGQVRCDEDVLWRLAPHDISIFLYLLDKIPSVISAQGFSYIQSNLADVVFALLRFESTIAHIQVSWLDPHKIRQLTVVGSKKMAVFDDTDPEHKLRIYDKGIKKTDLSVRMGEVFFPPTDIAEVLAIECAEFVSCIASRRQPLSSARLGLEVITVLESISRIMRMEER